MKTTEQQDQAIRILQEAYDAFNRGDIAAAVQQLDDQIEWTEPEQFSGGGTYYGRAGVASYLTQSRAGWAEGRSEPVRFILVGDRIVVFVHARIRPQGGNEWREVDLADVYTFRSGTPIQMRAFADRKEALRWAGTEDETLA
jgi:uncharacterized protein